MKVPADIDQLMWLLAESEDEAAAQEFIKRFKEFEIEFLRRRATVRGLKMAKPGASDSTKKVPVFTPRPVTDTPRLARPLAFGLASLGLAAFAFGSYAVVSRMLSRPGPEPKPAVSQNNPPLAPQNSPSVNDDPNSVPKGNSTTAESELPKGMERPIREENEDRSDYSVVLEEAPLDAALQAIAGQVGITVELAPGLPNPNVSVQFEGMTPRQMLEKLGRENGFTALYQGKGHWLIVPSMKFSDPTG